MRKRVSPGEYLAFPSVKYEVNPDKLFYGLSEEKENIKNANPIKEGVLGLKFKDNAYITPFMPLYWDTAFYNSSTFREFNRVSNKSQHLNFEFILANKA
jgi:hypothetical protein